MSEFPRTEVEGVSLPRMLIGSNWILGYSHTSTSADRLIRDRHSTPEAISAVLEAYLSYGIDALMAPIVGNQLLLEGVKMAEDRTGKKITLISTPGIDVSDTPEGRRAAEATIKAAKEAGSTFCLIHHGSAEQLVSKLHHTLDRLPDYLYMIRENGMIPGLSAHMPELILFSDEQGYDVQTYVQIYNCMGFLMQVEIEYIHKVIWGAKKPVMTIKSMAAGRCSPFVGLTFSYSTIRPCDMVTVGAFTPNEVHEDVEIAMAAIERRPPDIAGRSSPVKTVVMGAK